MTPRRVLHVATFAFPDRFGGAERVVAELAAAQARRGSRVTLVSGHDVPAIETAVEQGVERVRFPLSPRSRGLSFWRAARRGAAAALARQRSTEFDVVHAHQPATAAVALAFRARASVASFYAPWAAERAVERAGSHPLLTWLEWLRGAAVRRLDRSAVAGAGRVIVLSRFSREQLATLAPAAAERAVVVAPGVDVARFRPGDRAALRRDLGWPIAGLVVLTVRRLVKRMGVDDLLHAFAAVAGARPDSSLVIAGEGPERARLERDVATLALRDRVALPGAVADEALPRLLAAADLFVLPSRALEGFGLVTLEALACGTPVLATSAGANPEVLGELTPGCAPVPVGSAGITGGLRDFLAAPMRWREAASAAAAAIGRRFTWDACAERTDAVYDQALGEDRA